MAAANTYGVTAAAVASRLGVTLAVGGGRMTSAAITDEINRKAGFVRDICVRQGLASDDLEDGDQGYAALHVYLMDLVCEAIATALNRGDEARGYAMAAKTSRDLLFFSHSSTAPVSADSSVTTSITADVAGLAGQILRGGL